MTVHPTPLADLHTALSRLADGLGGASDLEGTSPEYFQRRLLPILAALGEAAQAASVALEPALKDETYRAIAADVYRANVQAGEV